MEFVKSIFVLIFIVFLAQTFWWPVLVIPNLLPTNQIRPLEWITPRPLKQAVTIPHDNRLLQADLYLPRSNYNPDKVLILIHGVNETGKDDERIANFGQTLARSSIVTLVPTFPDLLRSSFKPRAANEISACIKWIKNRYPQAKLGLVSFSVAGGPMFIAANETPDLDLLLAFGSHYDLKNVLKHVTTDPNADPFGKELLSRQYRELFGLNPPLEAVLQNTDPNRFDELYKNVPQEIKHFIADLSPKDHLQNIHSKQVILAHSLPDAIVPHTESLMLKEWLPHAQLTFLRVFSHVTIQLPRPTPNKIVNYYIPEAYKLYRIILTLLSFG